MVTRFDETPQPNKTGERSPFSISPVAGERTEGAAPNFVNSVGNAEIKAMEPRLAIKIESLHAILDEVAQSDARAKKVKPQELVDSRYLDEMEKSEFMDRLWAKR
jgi:hypothetical protein